MSEPLIKHLALVSESESVSTAAVMVVAAALQKQASRDLAPIWGVSATVDAFERLADVPLDYWPMIIRDRIPYPASGIHLDRNGQPFALIVASAQQDVWSLIASHEALEMLVDPFGNRLVAGDSIKPDQSRVNYLVEVCDPSEATEFAYSVNGVLVSDFYTPHFFDPTTAPGVRYSYTGDIRQPRTILRGGYVSWVDLETNIWWQQKWTRTPQPEFKELGLLNASQSLRSQIDRITAEETAEAASRGREVAQAAGALLEASTSAGEGRARNLHDEIAQLIEAAG